MNFSVLSVILYGSSAGQDISGFEMNPELSIFDNFANLANLDNIKKTNDIDIMVLIGERAGLVQRKIINGLVFEIFYYNILEIFSEVVSGNTDDKIYSISRGKLLFDQSSGLFDIISGFAKRRYSKGPEPSDERSKILANTGMQNFLIEIEKYISEEKFIDALAVMNRLFTAIIKNYYVWNGKWEMPPKKRMTDIKNSDSVFYEKISGYLNEKNIQTKYMAIKRLYLECVRPHSDILQGSWEISRGGIKINEEINIGL